jgi:hypothetical protein
MNDLILQNLTVGNLTRTTPETLVDWNYIDCPGPIVTNIAGAGGAHGVMADGEKFTMIFPGKNNQMTACACMNIGVYTVAASGYIIEGAVAATDASGTAAGLNLQGDAASADNTGLEIIVGGTPFGGGSACTIGEHAMTFDVTFHSVDWTDYDACAIGFRKIEEFEVAHGDILAAASGDPEYTDFVAFGCQSADDVQIATRLNDGTAVFTDSTDATAADGNHRFKVTVSEAGVVTYEHIGAAVMEGGTLAAPSTTAEFTFDTGDVVVPYMIVQGANANSAVHLKSMKITRSPGVQYQD